MVYGEIEKIMIDDWELISQYIRLVIEASDLPKWGHYELIDVDNSFKLTDTHEYLRNKFMNNIERQFYCDIYKRREYSEDEEEFMSAMTTLLLGQFYGECGLTDEDYEESLRNSNNKYIKESGEFTLDDNLVYDEIKGLWVLKDTGEIMVKSGRKDISVSGTKKNDIEIGEDQKQHSGDIK